MKYLVALLAGAGAAFLASAVGQAALLGVFEAAWWADLDAPLSGRAAFHAFLSLPAVIAFVLVGWCVLRACTRATDARAEAKALAFTALSAIGGGATGYYLAEFRAFEFWQKLGYDGFDLKNAYIESLIFGSASLFLIGLVLALIHFRRGRPRSTLLWNGALAAVTAWFALIPVPMVAKTFSESHYQRGVNITVRFEIRYPEGSAAPKSKGSVDVAVISGDEVRDGFFYGEPFARKDGTRDVIEGAAWLKRPVTPRTLVMNAANAPKRIFMLHLPAKPKASGYGPWQKVDFIEPHGGTRRAPTDAEAGFEIRYKAD